MSEQLSPDVERHEHLHTPEAAESRTEQEPQKSEERRPETHHEDIDTIKHKIEHEAKSGKEIKVGKTSEKASEHHYVTSELKQEALRRSLQRARKHLSVANKAFSKAVHQPVVDVISKVGEKTIARPTGILTGSILALIGSSYVLYSAKHYGFNYNFSVVLVLFAGGYAAGLVIELLIYSLRRRARR